MLTIDSVAYETFHCETGYMAKVQLRAVGLHSDPGGHSHPVIVWFHMTKDNGRGLANKWKAERLSVGHRDGTPPLPPLVGYGQTRAAAIRNAIRQTDPENNV